MNDSPKFTENMIEGELSIREKEAYVFYRRSRPLWKMPTVEQAFLAGFRSNPVNKDLFDALEGILSIGKRDLTNPKYDGYFENGAKALAVAAKQLKD